MESQGWAEKLAGLKKRMCCGEMISESQLSAVIRQMLIETNDFENLKWGLSFTRPGSFLREAVLSAMLKVAREKEQLRFIWSKTVSDSPIERAVVSALAVLTSDPLELERILARLINGGRSARIIQTQLSALRKNNQISQEVFYEAPFSQADV